MADLVDGVLNDDGDIGGHGDDDTGAKGGGLGEEVEVAEGKGELDGLLHVDGDGRVVLLVDARGGVDEDVSSAEVSRDGEANSVLVHGNGAGVSEDLKVPDDPLELSRRHTDSGLVLGVWDSKVVGINVHEL